MPLKPCLECGALSKNARCPGHTARKQAGRDARRAPFRAGRYGPEHRAERKRWEPAVATGTVRCRRGEQCLHAPDGILIGRGAEWHLGHPDQLCQAPLAPEHADCNTHFAGVLS